MHSVAISIDVFAGVWALLCVLGGALVFDTLLRSVPAAPGDVPTLGPAR